MVGFLPPLVQEAPLSGMVTILFYAASSVVAGAAVGLSLGMAGGSLRGFDGSAASRLLVGLAALGRARPPFHAQGLLPWAMHRAVGVACLGLVMGLALTGGG